MPPTTALRTPLRAWRCPQCTLRSFSTTPQTASVGPEHPRFIDIPEPPQQSAPYKPFIKGRLPIPRDIFAGRHGKDRASDAEIAKATRRPRRQVAAEPGSREEWSQKLSESRRRNLAEGLKGLRARQTRLERQSKERRARDQAEREELISRPEREDERLTTPSHGLDLEKLLHASGPLPDPTRSARLAHKARNLEKHQEAKRAERLDNLHTLYMNARSFIVNTSQLDAAVEEAFGTAEKPATFVGGFGGDGEGASMWARGKPSSVQEMLNRANRGAGSSSMFAMDGAGGYSSLNQERVKRIAEELTGGKMEGGGEGGS